MADADAECSDDDENSVDSTSSNVVADPDGWNDFDTAGDVGSNAIDVCAADLNASADANTEGSGDDENSVDSTSDDVVADPDG